jgi:hypothetical protein
MIALTFDLDWAPDAVIADTLELLARMNVRATIFATHKCEILNGSGHELGIHPRFDGSEREAIVRRLLDLYPSARGVRSHSLVTCSHTVLAFAACGLSYTSNVLAWLNPGVGPFRHFAGPLEIPFHWGDSSNLQTMRDWSPEALPLSCDRLFVFNFHPIHVFLNTEAPERWQAARKNYQDIDFLRRHVNAASEFGTRVFLQALCRHIAEERIPIITLGDLAAKYDGVGKSRVEQSTQQFQGVSDGQTGTY